MQVRTHGTFRQLERKDLRLGALLLHEPLLKGTGSLSLVKVTLERQDLRLGTLLLHEPLLKGLGSLSLVRVTRGLTCIVTLYALKLPCPSTLGTTHLCIYMHPKYKNLSKIRPKNLEFRR
jgi:hypothetical protein